MGIIANKLYYGLKLVNLRSAPNTHTLNAVKHYTDRMLKRSEQNNEQELLGQ